MINQQVGALGQADSSLRHPPSRIVIIAARKQLRPKRAPGDRCLQRVPSETLTLRTQFIGLGTSVEGEACATQQRGSLGGVCVETHASKAVVGLTQIGLRRNRVVDDEFDDAGKLLDLKEGMAQAELGDRAPRRVDHPSGCRGASAEGLQHGLAPCGRCLDRGRVGRDSEQSHDVKTPPARARNRVRAPQRRKWRAGQYRVHPPVVTCAPRRCESVVQGDFAIADSAEARKTSGPNGMSLGFPCGIVQSGQFVGGRADRGLGLVQSLRMDQHRELAVEARRPCRETG